MTASLELLVGVDAATTRGGCSHPPIVEIDLGILVAADREAK